MAMLQNQWYHFGIGATGDWEYGALDPWPCGNYFIGEPLSKMVHALLAPCK